MKEAFATIVEIVAALVVFMRISQPVLVWCFRPKEMPREDWIFMSTVWLEKFL
jgi:hypothetical protein